MHSAVTLGAGDATTHAHRHTCAHTHRQRRAVPKDALLEIMHKELCKGVLPWRSEGAQAGGTRSGGGLTHKKDKMKVQGERWK